MIRGILALLLAGLLAVPAWAAVKSTVDSLDPEVRGFGGDSYLILAVPAMPVISDSQRVRGVVVEIRADLPPGTTLELWAHEGDGLPWDSQAGVLVDMWTLDERTGDLVRFRLPPALRAGTTLWIRLDPAEENTALTAKTVLKTERVVTLGRERRRRP